MEQAAQFALLQEDNGSCTGMPWSRLCKFAKALQEIWGSVTAGYSDGSYFLQRYYKNIAMIERSCMQHNDQSVPSPADEVLTWSPRTQMRHSTMEAGSPLRGQRSLDEFGSPQQQNYESWYNYQRNVMAVCENSASSFSNSPGASSSADPEQSDFAQSLWVVANALQTAQEATPGTFAADFYQTGSFTIDDSDEDDIDMLSQMISETEGVSEHAGAPAACVSAGSSSGSSSSTTMPASSAQAVAHGSKTPQWGRCPSCGYALSAREPDDRISRLAVRCRRFKTNGLGACRRGYFAYMTQKQIALWESLQQTRGRRTDVLKVFKRPERVRRS